MAEMTTDQVLQQVISAAKDELLGYSREWCDHAEGDNDPENKGLDLAAENMQRMNYIVTWLEGYASRKAKPTSTK